MIDRDSESQIQCRQCFGCLDSIVVIEAGFGVFLVQGPSSRAFISEAVFRLNATQVLEVTRLHATSMERLEWM